jgi:tetratricopeptide (TPR) repeat protein
MSEHVRVQSMGPISTDRDASVIGSLEQLSRRLDVPESALARMMHLISDKHLQTEQLDPRLREVAVLHNQLAMRLRNYSANDPEIRRLHTEAAAAIERGDYAAADALLAKAGGIDTTTSETQPGSLGHRQHSLTQTLTRRGELERVRLDYWTAAERFAESAALLSDDARLERWNLLIEQASALYAQGDEFGDNEALIEAVEVYRIALAERSRDEAPLDWAATQNNLGNAFSLLGEREVGTTRLEEAVTAYRAALEVRLRELEPFDWAATLNNLGATLSLLGERESGTARLGEAVAACSRPGGARSRACAL